jgi:hypothetical protein
MRSPALLLALTHVRIKLIDSSERHRVVDTLIGIASLVTGFIFYRGSLRVKQPLFLVKSNALIRNSISDISGLEITYKGVQIADLFISEVLFCNCGAETLHRQDIVSGNPLRIVCSKDSFMLDAGVVKSNNQYSGLTVDVDSGGGVARISFEYLDQGHGGIIQIVYAGDSCEDLTILGDLKGARLQIRKHNREMISNISDLSVALVSFLLVLISFRSLVHLPRMTGFVICISIIIGILLFAPILTRWVNYILNPLPRDFRNFK